MNLRRKEIERKQCDNVKKDLEIKKQKQKQQKKTQS